MPRGKRLNKEARFRIIEAHKNGASTAALAREYGVSRWTVYRLVQRFEETGQVDLRFARCGRKPKLTASQLAAIQKALAEEPNLRMQELHERLQIPCTLRALYYIVKKKGFKRGRDDAEPKKNLPFPVWRGRAYLCNRIDNDGGKT